MSGPVWDEKSLLQKSVAGILPFVVKILAILLLTAVAYGLWLRVRADVLRSENYRFSAGCIRITEIPPWVPESLVSDVLANSGLTQQETVIDEGLLKEMMQAFQSHPWIESVEGIHAKYPGIINVGLKYRKAVCMVQTPKKDGFYAVDKHGVYLPSDYFLKTETSLDNYIKVFGAKSMPMGMIGQPWGDEAVEGAAQIADHLHVNNDNSILRIASIKVETTGTGRRARRIFTLTTSKGTDVIWGEMPIAPDDSRKERLLELVRQYGTLDKVPAQLKPIDLTKTPISVLY
ncbi:MAG: hypothetical protein FWC50_04480 [Planctomycetaceae bacterium]|nr:hypothetical protein [Planctomycetaceae bacterium]